MLQLAVLGVEAPAARHAAHGDDDAIGAGCRHLDLRRQRVRLVVGRDDRALAQPVHAAEQQLRLALDELRPAGEVRVEALEQAAVEREHVVLDRFDQEQPLKLVQFLRMRLGEVLRLAPVGVGVVELPDILVERAACTYQSRGRRAG